MMISPLPPILVGAAGAPLAQTKGADTERAPQEAAAQQRQVQGDAKAEMAAGIGTTEEQSSSDPDRDADGRRLWEAPQQPNSPQDAAAPSTQAPRSRDASGQSGTQLDLTG